LPARLTFAAAFRSRASVTVHFIRGGSAQNATSISLRPSCKSPIASPRAQAQSRGPTATNQLDGQINSDLQKLCQAQESKIFRSRRRANHIYNSARLTRRRGVGRRHVRCGEMRWPLKSRRRAWLMRTAKSCGSGARSWRQVALGSFRRGDGGNRARLTRTTTI